MKIIQQTNSLGEVVNIDLTTMSVLTKTKEECINSILKHCNEVSELDQYKKTQNHLIRGYSIKKALSREFSN